MRKCHVDTWNMFKQIHEDPVNIFCQESATVDVFGMPYKRYDSVTGQWNWTREYLGKCCPYHAKQTELLMQAADGLVVAIQSKN